MSEKFTASNGLQVAWVPNGSGMKVLQTNSEYAKNCLPESGWRIPGAASSISDSNGFTEQSECAAALREFFQHERDKELGRWRSRLHPDWTAVVDSGLFMFKNDDGIHAFSVAVRSRDYSGWAPELREVAKEYLEAHPEPKPWQDAKPGEVWVVDFEAGVTEAVMVPSSGWVKGLAVVDARRIWPEES